MKLCMFADCEFVPTLLLLWVCLSFALLHAHIHTYMEAHAITHPPTLRMHCTGVAVAGQGRVRHLWPQAPAQLQQHLLRGDHRVPPVARTGVTDLVRVH